MILLNKKKLFYITLLTIIALFILSAYNAFNGNPITKYMSKKTVERYLKETYPNETIRITEGSYNFKFSSYNFHVLVIGDSDNKEDSPKEYTIDTRGTINPKVRYDEIYYSRIDEELCDRLSKEAAAELSLILNKEIPNIKNLYVLVEVLKGQLPSNTAWSKDLVLAKPISLDLVFDSSKENKEDFFKSCESIQKLLASNGYKYSNVNINGNGFDKDLGAKDEFGYVKYAFSFDMKDKLEIKSVKELNKHLK